MLTIGQFIPELKVGFLFVYISLLCIVIAVSLLKELMDNINRSIQDLITNSTKITTLKLYSRRNLQKKN